jgi:hypothetical protein
MPAACAAMSAAAKDSNLVNKIAFFQKDFFKGTKVSYSSLPEVLLTTQIGQRLYLE